MLKHIAYSLCIVFLASINSSTFSMGTDLSDITFDMSDPISYEIEHAIKHVSALLKQAKPRANEPRGAAAKVIRPSRHLEVLSLLLRQLALSREDLQKLMSTTEDPSAKTILLLYSLDPYTQKALETSEFETEEELLEEAIKWDVAHIIQAKISSLTQHSKNRFLRLAASTQALAIIQILLEHGAEVNCEEEQQDTPLVCALASTRTKPCPHLTELLLKNKIDCPQGCPLVCALTSKQLNPSLAVVELLLKYGASPNVWTTGDSKLSTLDLARSSVEVGLLMNGQAPITRELVQESLARSVKEACFSGLDLRRITWLLMHGASPLSFNELLKLKCFNDESSKKKLSQVLQLMIRYGSQQHQALTRRSPSTKTPDLFNKFRNMPMFSVWVILNKKIEVACWLIRSLILLDEHEKAAAVANAAKEHLLLEEQVLSNYKISLKTEAKSLSELQLFIEAMIELAAGQAQIELLIFLLACSQNTPEAQANKATVLAIVESILKRIERERQDNILTSSKADMLVSKYTRIKSTLSEKQLKAAYNQLKIEL